VKSLSLSHSFASQDGIWAVLCWLSILADRNKCALSFFLLGCQCDCV
jgi:hypothetical protein